MSGTEIYLEGLGDFCVSLLRLTLHSPVPLGICRYNSSIFWLYYFSSSKLFKNLMIQEFFIEHDGPLSCGDTKIFFSLKNFIHCANNYCFTFIFFF